MKTKEKTLTYDFYSDPAHGWIKVPKAHLAKYGVAEQITPFSYMRGDDAFLEEDRDASIFIDALKRNGVTPRFRTHTAYERRSKIRSYEAYSLASA